MGFGNNECPRGESRNVEHTGLGEQRRVDSSHFSPEPRAACIRLPRPRAAHSASQAAGAPRPLSLRGARCVVRRAGRAAEAQTLEKRSRGRREWLGSTDLIRARLGPECRASTTIRWSHPEMSRVLAAAVRVRRFLQCLWVSAWFSPLGHLSSLAEGERLTGFTLTAERVAL